MAWSKKREPDLLDDLDIFLRDLCVEWGFCNRLSPDDLVSVGKAITADEFARAVLVAEGMNPDCSEWLRPIRDKFSQRYGSSVSPEKYATWHIDCNIRSKESPGRAGAIARPGDEP